ncbi:hypothetical protein V4890_23175 [Ralstonia solanacearum species complex bacterium KE056]|uniref:hypothetical protein n=1 Tax=Ralstonia solanacearum species complex bacterium KE056 TaxID=3119585 RepID=UPI002FC35F29
MNKWRNFFRAIIFFAIGVFFLIGTHTLLWAPFLILSALFFSIDVLGVGRRKDEGRIGLEEPSGPYGVLGDYVVDATESYGLFIELLSDAVFVDVKKDDLIEQRKQQALYLFKNQKILEDDLGNFIKENPEYKARKILYIGLHSREQGRGEVFWDPHGYTLLRGTNFLP